MKKHHYDIIGAAREIHKADYWIALPWMQETALKLQQINFPTEISMPVPYKKIEVASNLRCDLSTENC
ncbi:hypothetical protein EA772_05515 [Pedobacter sp. G11]|uniref:hypothetical protein n=1 Tax=Pedobacter sp. G11 TaxID=2482728 RepID=UPI000F5E07B9|nr:hypothetical protein [Pedobacter sp. G11]AZI24829.1 hypothetical protein EA772_05515 [Pedobacter sp. G11]